MSSRHYSARLSGPDEREPISIGEEKRKNDHVHGLVKAWTSANPEYGQKPVKGHEDLNALSKVQEEAARKELEHTEKIFTLTQELRALRHSHSCLLEVNNDLVTDVNREKEEKRALERQLAEKDANLKDMQDKKGTAGQELQETLALNDHLRQQMEQSERDYMKEINTLRREVTERNELVEKERRKNAKYAAFLAVDSSCHGSANQRTPTDMVIEHMKVEKSVLEEKLQESRDKVDALSAELEVERRNKLDLQMRLGRGEASLRADSRRSRDQFELSIRRNRELDIEKKVLVGKNRDLEGDNQRLLERNKKLHATIEQLQDRQGKLERAVSCHIKDRWTSDVSDHRRNLTAERAKWEAIENQKVELEMKLSELQRQYQLRVVEYQILERQNGEEARAYQGEREKWMNEKKSLETQLDEKEKSLQQKTTEIQEQLKQLKEKGICDADHEKDRLRQKLHEKETENKSLQQELSQLRERQKLKHRQRSRTSSCTAESSLSSFESSMSSSTSTLRDRVAHLESLIQQQQFQEPRRMPVTHTQRIRHASTSETYDPSQPSTFIASSSSPRTSHYTGHGRFRTHSFSPTSPSYTDSQETNTVGSEYGVPPLDPNLVCSKCGRRFRHGEIQDFRFYCQQCSKH